MNKKQLILLVGILLILVGFIISMLFVFIGLYRSSYSAEHSSDSGSKADIEQYVIDSWHFQDCTWDSKSNTLTAIRTYDLTYEEAQEIGSRVFVEDLAPESYLAQTVTIEADLRSRFSMESLTIVLSFRGNDNSELFRVDSTGQISTCWNAPE